MIENRRVVLTGGAGFIGARLAAALCERNEVVIFDSLHRDTASRTGVLDHPNVTLVRGDVLDSPALERALDGAEIVVHLAAIAGVESVLRSPIQTMRVNVIGTFNVLEAAARLDSVVRFVDFSTSEVFGRYAYKVEETHISPTISVGEARWSYAVGKLAGEFASHAYGHEVGLPVTTLRPFNVYGPGQTGEGAIHHFVKRALVGEDLVVHGDGSQIRAWCYIDDMIEATLLAMEKEEAVGEAFNIGNPQSTLTVLELARTVIRATRSSSKVVFQPLHYVDIEVRIPDVNKARQQLGFAPRVDLEEGLKRTADWYRTDSAKR